VLPDVPVLLVEPLLLDDPLELELPLDELLEPDAPLEVCDEPLDDFLVVTVGCVAGFVVWWVTGVTVVVDGTDEVAVDVVAADDLADEVVRLTWCLILAVFVVVSDFGALVPACGATEKSG
jgi:hypothetical protein